MEQSGFPSGMTNSPEQTTIRTRDFTFEPLTLEHVYQQHMNIPFVAVACLPRAEVVRPAFDESALAAEWDIEEIARRAKRPA